MTQGVLVSISAVAYTRILVSDRIGAHLYLRFSSLYTRLAVCIGLLCVWRTRLKSHLITSRLCASVAAVCRRRRHTRADQFLMFGSQANTS